MARPAKPACDLTDAERRDLTQLIAEGRPLPEKYRFILFEDRWTGGFIFENEWQSFRTRQNRDLQLETSEHAYQRPGRYTVAVKVIDIFGNDTMTLVPVNVG